MALGTHPVVTRGIVGTVKQDKKLVKKELEVKQQFGEIIAEIALDKYNPDKTGLNEGMHDFANLLFSKGKRRVGC